MATTTTVDEINIAINTATTTTIAGALSGANDYARIKPNNLYFRNRGASTNVITLEKFVDSTTAYEVMEFTLTAEQEKKLPCDISQKGTGSIVRVKTSTTSATDITGTRIHTTVT